MSESIPSRAPDLNTDTAGLLAQQLPPQYEILGKVSEGGMGAIYKAQNRFTGRLCAIKVLRPDSAYDKEKLLRFVYEAKAASSLDHQNICRVYDFGTTPEQMPYLVMDWIEGISLHRKIYRDGPLPPAEAEHIFAQVVDALAHAHDHRVVHRDLKPENIMLSRENGTNRTLVHLVDFGIAKVLNDDTEAMKSDALTRTGMVVGTPMFMSPEQATAKEVDGRSDIYSLGCVMYFALTATIPFYGETYVETLYKHIHNEPPEMASSLKIPHALKMIVLRCMEKKPHSRYQTMHELSSDLRKHTAGDIVVRPPLTSSLLRYRRRIAAATFFIASFSLALVVSLVVQNVLDTVAPEKPTKDAKPSTHLHRSR